MTMREALEKLAHIWGARGPEVRDDAEVMYGCVGHLTAASSSAEIDWASVRAARALSEDDEVGEEIADAVREYLRGS